MNKIECLEKLKELYSFTKTIKSQQEICILEKKHMLDVNFYFTATFDLALNTEDEVLLSLEETDKILSLSDNDSIIIYPTAALDINVVPDSYFSSLFDQKLGEWVQNSLLQEYSNLVFSLVKSMHPGEVFLC